MTGKIKELKRDFHTFKPEITLVMDSNDLEQLEKLQGEELEITIKKKSRKRGLRANRYYWELLNQLAASLRVSNAWMHNSLLQRYGTFVEIGSQVPFVYLDDDADYMENQEVHLKPTGQPGEFILLKGSHEYNSKEMARLIDGLVEECKAQGIETMDKEEIERLVQEWKA